MKPIVRQSERKAAFTIVELLTVMSIIIILIGLLVPGLNMAKRYAKMVTQKNQFHGIDSALELFNAEYEGYPDSDEKDSAESPQSYCGAMKLCEAMMGQDLKGFHPDTLFRHDGKDGSSANNDLYPDKDKPDEQQYALNLKSRKGPYLQLESANAYALDSVYSSTSPFDPIPNRKTPDDKDYYPFVLCDEYTRVTNLGTTGSRKIGMPILYYRADISKTKIDTTDENNQDNIYDYKDNDELVQLGMPWDASAPKLAHPIASTGGSTSTGASPDPKIFYKMIANDKIATGDRPFRPDSYILMSAGFDGEYGTPDDVFNFTK